MRFKKSPQLPGAGRTRAWHYHGSHTPTSPGAINGLSTQTFWPPVQEGVESLFNNVIVAFEPKEITVNNVFYEFICRFLKMEAV